VLKACLDLLRLRGVLAWRNNSGALRDATGRPVRFGAVGSPDILAVGPHGRLWAIECKAPGRKPTAAQRAFLGAVEAAGGLAVVVSDVRELVEVLDRELGGRAVDAMEAQYRALKAQDPGRILIFRGDVPSLVFALHGDATELDRLAAGRLPRLGEPPGSWDRDRVLFRAEDLEALLSLIVAAGRRAAVLERVEGAPPGGVAIGRWVTPGEV
jgi:hypothetical protein